jgi:flagellar basal-body rod protein FlgC
LREAGVNVARIVEDDKPFVEKYDPGHPDADENGVIRLPNVNIVEEMVNMISASRSFEANATAVRATKDMAGIALEIGRS